MCSCGKNRSFQWFCAVFTALLLAACSVQQQPVPPDGRPDPPNINERFYRQAAADGGAVYRIDSDRSLVQFYVRRGGRLAKFGHDHVVASRDIEGYLLLPPAGFRIPTDADGNAVVDTGAPNWPQMHFRLPVEQLSVDEPALRRAAGFDSTPDAEDIAGTRRNMLEKVLNASAYPWIHGRAWLLTAVFENPTLGLSLNIHDTAWSGKLAVDVRQTEQGLEISGSLPLTQSDFGIVPYSLLGGALRVEDVIEGQFRILAKRFRPSDD